MSSEIAAASAFTLEIAVSIGPLRGSVSRRSKWTRQALEQQPVGIERDPRDKLIELIAESITCAVEEPHQPKQLEYYKRPNYILIVMATPPHLIHRQHQVP